MQAAAWTICFSQETHLRVTLFVSVSRSGFLHHLDFSAAPAPIPTPTLHPSLFFPPSLLSSLEAVQTLSQTHRVNGKYDRFLP